MKNTTLITVITFLLLVGLSQSSLATEWGKVVDLKGMWSFSVGDDANWSALNVNTEDWDHIYVPNEWEEYYEGYNGFAWYRKEFDMRMAPEGELVMILGEIDDVDEVFLNGVKIGQTGSFLPNYRTAHDTKRVYSIPTDLLKEKNNVVAVRVYDEGGGGGIRSGKRIGIFYDNDRSLLSLDMSGQWKFSVFREKGMFDKDFDDSKWNSIKVPDFWENQGYNDHDGTAWYRTKFSVPDELKNEDVYLVLGRIDDYDKVYLNGNLFARTEYLDVYDRTTRYQAYRFYRVYKIPSSKLDDKNVLVVEVRDEQLSGGIYEGPIGLMNYRNAKTIEERNEDEVWDNPLRALFRLFD